MDVFAYLATDGVRRLTGLVPAASAERVLAALCDAKLEPVSVRRVG